MAFASRCEFFRYRVGTDPNQYPSVSYDPIVAPVLALIIWHLLAWLMCILPAAMLWAGDEFDPPLTAEERQRNTDRWNRRHKWYQAQPVPFFMICLALAVMGAGTALANWLAWAFTASWVTFHLFASSPNQYLRYSGGIVAGSIGAISLDALAAYAGIRVTHDMLAAYG